MLAVDEFFIEKYSMKNIQMKNNHWKIISEMVIRWITIWVELFYHDEKYDLEMEKMWKMDSRWILIKSSSMANSLQPSRAYLMRAHIGHLRRLYFSFSSFLFEEKMLFLFIDVFLIGSYSLIFLVMNYHWVFYEKFFFFTMDRVID